MRNCRGFTLIEVVVAFAVLSMALAVLLQIFGGSLRNAHLAGHYTEATLLAQSALELYTTEGELAEGVETGGFGERYRWERVVEPYPMGPVAADELLDILPYRVTLRVDWRDRGAERSVSLTTLALGAGE
ncbi:MAG: type II secretion system protein [Chromatiales bacterium]|jgi:general secretion pathway protein I